MARTPLARRLRDAFASAAPAERTAPWTPGDAAYRANAITRRELLLRAGALGVAAAAAGVVPRRASGATGPRIAVVGAGLAGLTCAYRLKQAGYAADVYEASERAGGAGHCAGRSRTARSSKRAASS